MPLIDIALIDIPAGRRKLDPVWVEALSEMFSDQGQETDIIVRETDDRFRLVAGGHRIAAAKLIGWKQISAKVRTREELATDADLVRSEITENLARRDLSALDKAVDIARWREAYEAAQGEVKRGRPSKLSQVATISDEGADKFAASFSEAARKALGINRDAVSRAMRIASIGADLRGRIALYPIADNQSELLALAAEPTERQQKIVGWLTAEPAPTSSVAEAIAILDRTPKPVAKAKWQKLSTTFSQLKEAEQDRFFDLHEAAIQRWLKARGA